jgi:hypothetical protein
MFNKNFGSVFRTHSGPTLFTQSILRYRCVRVAAVLHRLAACCWLSGAWSLTRTRCALRNRSDIYTSHLENLLNISPDHYLYPPRRSLPHEPFHPSLA